MRALPLIVLAGLGLVTPVHAQSTWDAVGATLGKEGSIQSDGVYRIGVLRSDLQVTLDGVDIEPGLALGTWMAFKGTDSGAMLMGDLVLTEDEVNPVMERLLEGASRLLRCTST